MVQPEFSYVQARLQARLGAMPDATAWQVLEASHTVEHYLTLARSGPLAPWVAGIDRVDGLDPTGAAHLVERQLRLQWRRHVDEVARWLPQRWQAAVRWFGGLPDLALLDEPRQAGAAARWLGAWQRLLPPGEATVPALLQRCAAALMPGLPSGAARGGSRAAATEPLRLALRKLFRRHGSSPVAVFVHLALVGLDLERLRGGIVTRVLLPPGPAPDPRPDAVPRHVPQAA